MEPRPTEGRVVDAGREVTADGDVVMIDAEAGGENADRGEEARNHPEEARESGIARVRIASETRPKPVEEWLEREIEGKVFKLGRSLERELQDQIAKVIERHLDAFAWSASNMPRIDPDFLCHHLAMDTRSDQCDREEESLMRREDRRLGMKRKSSSSQAISGRSSTLSG